MKRIATMSVLCCILTLLATSCCCRNIRTADDITPGNPVGGKLDWRYGAADIRIQTTKITGSLMDRWYQRAGEVGSQVQKPRLIITEIDNRTDMYISTDMIRDIIEGVAVNDGRFTVVVGDLDDECQMDDLMRRISNDPKYRNRSQLDAHQAIAPEFLGKIRITKAVTADKRYDYEDYRMTVTLYDIETQVVIDSAWDVLRKRIRA